MMNNQIENQINSKTAADEAGYGIVVDSCCDLTPQVRESLAATVVPLTMRLGEVEYMDDEGLDLPGFIAAMKKCTKAVGSASPAPTLYQQAFEQNRPSYAVTLSSKLSGSFGSAMMGKAMAEENGYRDIHIFDSKSASAGQTLVALKLRELISAGLERSAVIEKAETFIDNMKTYFVLERYDNLQKNGRLGRITGKLANVMHIKLVMGADGNGNIQLFAKPRGTGNMLEKLVSLIGESGKKTEGERMVISHCNNHGLVQQLCQRIEDKFGFSEILVMPTGGLSSLYADDGGIVMAF